MNKKSVSALLSLMMFANMTGISAGALDETDTEFESETVFLERCVSEPSKYGLVNEGFVDENGEIAVFDFVPEIERYDVLPSYYNAYQKGYVTKVKDQGTYGVCWSFAGLSCVESSLIIKGVKDSSIDLSERHLNWFTNGADCADQNDPLYGGCLNLGTEAYDYGGNSGNVTAVLARGSGPVEERFFPYSYTDPIDESYRYNSLARLSETAEFSPSDINGIKYAVMQYGSLYCSMNYFTSVKNDGADYLRDDTAGYYCPVSPTMYTECGHAVTIVGWDDNFSKDKFLKTPEGDGAWIIKNSHGTKSGDNGFFYLSYYDKTYGAPGINDIVAFDMAPADEYGNVYQYDANFGFMAGYIDCSTAGANIFTAEENEAVEAVSFYTNSADTDYIIQVYTGLVGSSPTSGTLAYSSEGISPYAGYHTVELDTPVSVAKGESFSVVVIVSPNSEGKAYMAFDTYAPKEGQSYMTYYYNGRFGSWEDTKNNGYERNVCIKAFTNAADVTEKDIVDIDSTNFTDSVFRQYVKDNFDTDGSGGLSESEINKVTYIYVPGTSSKPGSISDLTGIELFPNITSLYCEYNKLTSLDLSGNTALTEVFCNGNSIKSLNVSKNTELIYLWCQNNQLTSLDVKNNTKLTSLVCSNNFLTSLDVSRNTKLTALNCSNNYLAGIDVSKNAALDSLVCTGNVVALGDVKASLCLDSYVVGFDGSRASDWQGADYDVKTNTLKNITSCTITYSYDCGNGKTAKFTLNCSLVTISGITVTSDNVVITYSDGSALKLSFDEVNEAVVDFMIKNDMKSCAAFVNAFSEGKDTMILTSAELKAVEAVLASDYGA